MIFGFAEKFDEFERFIRDTAVEFVGDVGRTAFDNMNETENRLWTEVVKKIYDKALDNPSVKKYRIGQFRIKLIKQEQQCCNRYRITGDMF